MKQLTCEMCGSTDLIKDGGVFVCQSCGCKYSIEEAKRLMIEGTVDVTGSTVKVDTSGELANLYQIARRAKDDNNSENAAKFYEMVLMKDPTSWEASFYVVYFKAMGCKIAQIKSAGISVKNCINTVLKLIRENVPSGAEQKAAYTEVAKRVLIISDMLFKAGKKHYLDQLQAKYEPEWIDNGLAAIGCAFAIGDNLDLLFGNDTEANQLSVLAWRQGIALQQSLMITLGKGAKAANKDIVEYVYKIKKYDSRYTVPYENAGGCYVATAVYGSYDCPQVWTLRRYRDYTLAETWYGRAFIHTYYAISPTLVKWFGHTEWFKKMWKGKLDRMVANLNAEGVEDTPYEDKEW